MVVQVEVGQGNDPDVLAVALKSMKRVLGRGGFYRDVKRHQAFMSPGARRRSKANRARRKQAKYARLRARRDAWLDRNGLDERPRKVVDAAR
jgi:ribosomal protein S21